MERYDGAFFGNKEDSSDVRRGIEDMMAYFQCAREEIASTPDEITSKTRYYLGDLVPGLLAHLPQTVECIYTRFPDAPVSFHEVSLQTNRAPSVQDLRGRGIEVSFFAEQLLERLERDALSASLAQDTSLGASRPVRLVRLPVESLLGVGISRSLDDIFRKAQDLGLVLCPPAVGPVFCLRYQNQAPGSHLYVAMQPLNNESFAGEKLIFFFAPKKDDADSMGLSADFVDSHTAFSPHDQFLFLLSEE